jgi:hypothetical protein
MKSATQNTKLFNVVLTQSLQNRARSRPPSGRPKFQDYHGLRSVSYPKRLIDTVPSNPHNPIRLVNDQRHAIALVPRHLSVHKKILQFLLSIETEGPEPVARAPIADRQWTPPGVPPDNGRRPIARDCTKRVNADPSSCRLGRYDTPRLWQPDLSRNRQLITVEAGRLRNSLLS